MLMTASEALGVKAQPSGAIKRTSEGAQRLAQLAVATRSRIEHLRDHLIGVAPTAAPANADSCKANGLMNQVNEDLATVRREFDRIRNVLDEIEKELA